MDGRAFVQVQSDMRVSATQYFVPNLFLYHPESGVCFLKGRISGAGCPACHRVADMTFALDSGYKASADAAAGVPDYWVADLDAGRPIILRLPAQNGYQSVTRLQRGESIAPLACPDHMLNVEAIAGPSPGSTAPRS
ncbi:MAG: hypothetical protein RMM58_14965 [Chloroflexota bacterium]|nr:hypothetical protein [Chloroflexota bacterium]